MRIEYEKSMVSKIVDVREEADKNKKKIACIHLSDREWDTLALELNAPFVNAYWESSVTPCAAQARAAGGYVLFVFGVRICLEPHVKT